jgi:hypothetical protein
MEGLYKVEFLQHLQSEGTPWGISMPVLDGGPGPVWLAFQSKDAAERQAETMNLAHAAALRSLDGGEVDLVEVAVGVESCLISMGPGGFRKPVRNAFDRLISEVRRLRARVAELEGKQ